MRSLARALARGRTIAAWAGHNGDFLETAQQWSELPEFQLICQWSVVSCAGPPLLGLVLRQARGGFFATDGIRSMPATGRGK